MRLASGGRANLQLGWPVTVSRSRLLALQALFLLPLLLGVHSLGAERDYEVVILHGRVIDPKSGLDARRNIGIADGTIQAITEQPLTGRTLLDATNLIVAPGFIDLHAHGQDHENYRVQVMDGVTTALELEIGTEDIASWYSTREGQSLINYGVSVGHTRIRMQVMNDPGSFLPRGDAAHRAALASELQEIKEHLELGLQQGALGVGFGLQYTPAASRREILEMFRMAAPHGAPAYVHLRYMGLQEPNNSIAAMEEVVAASAITGTPLHIVHIQSSGLGAVPYLLEAIAEAQSRGLDVTTECYPYAAGMTGIESAIFDEGWQEVLGISYRDLEWAETGERLTPQTFAQYRDSGGLVILHFIPQEMMEAAVVSPITIIASDGLLRSGRGHPRTSGTYARMLGHFVREAGALTWMDAVAKASLMPAQRLQQRVPLMQNKGHIGVGADADLTIFDPEKVLDRSSYQSPAEYSEGMSYVLVAGVPVVMEGQLQEGLAPGQPIRAPAASVLSHKYRDSE